MQAAIKFKHFLVLLSFLTIPILVSAQKPEYNFKDGEYALYGAYYNWHFIWVQSGEVEFRSDTILYNNQLAWHLRSYGKTFKTYDMFYSVRDTFESYCSYKNFNPIYARRVINHSKDNSQHQYWFNYSNGTIKTRIKTGKEPVYTSEIPINTNTFDILSTAYNFRKYDFNKLIIGQKVPYRMLIEKEAANLYFRYLGKENIKTRNGKTYRCHKVSVYLLQGDFFKEGEYMKIWFTDDKNHLPVQVETEILIGSVKAILLNTKSLKYPLTSEIK